jgi:hypothetical protein
MVMLSSMADQSGQIDSTFSRSDTRSFIKRFIRQRLALPMVAAKGQETGRAQGRKFGIRGSQTLTAMSLKSL